MTKSVAAGARNISQSVIAHSSTVLSSFDPTSKDPTKMLNTGNFHFPPSPSPPIKHNANGAKNSAPKVEEEGTSMKVHRYNVEFLDADERQTQAFYDRIVESVSEPQDKLFATVQNRDYPVEEIILLEERMKKLSRNREYARSVLTQKLGFLRKARNLFNNLPPASKKSERFMLDVGQNLSKYNQKWEKINQELEEMAAVLVKELNDLTKRHPARVLVTLMLEAELMEFFTGNSAAKRQLLPLINNQPIRLKWAFKISSIALQMLAAEELFHINALNHCVLHDRKLKKDKTQNNRSEQDVDVVKRCWNMIVSLARDKHSKLVEISKLLTEASAKITTSTSIKEMETSYLTLKGVVNNMTEATHSADEEINKGLATLFKLEQQFEDATRLRAKTIISAATVYAPIPRGVPSFIYFVEFDTNVANAFAQATSQLLRQWSFYMQTAVLVSNLHSVLEIGINTLELVACSRFISVYESIAVATLNQRIEIENHLLDLWTLRLNATDPCSPEFLRTLKNSATDLLEKRLPINYRKLRDACHHFLDYAEELVASMQQKHKTNLHLSQRIHEAVHEIIMSLERGQTDIVHLQKESQQP